jgi:glyoxylase-like metal-dependent hydrolase (beta-lactamase superfamily II)
MDKNIPLDPSNRADRSEQDDDRTHHITGDLAYKRLAITNVVFVSGRPPVHWVLVDTGVPGSATAIIRAAEERFGSSPPACILLTHGHFDHAGSVRQLAEHWNVPVYAHPLEHPYLNGTAKYPQADPSVGGGMMARLSPLFPTGPYDIGRWLEALPADGSVPGLEDWQWIHTPGHTPGHVTFWNEQDRSMIVGDAFITTSMESAYAALTQRTELHGPPMYFTMDWDDARESVRRLAAMEPEIAVVGHGRPMRGAEMRAALHELADRFDEIAVPEHGRYVEEPARVEDGSAYRLE